VERRGEEGGGEAASRRKAGSKEEHTSPEFKYGCRADTGN